MFHAFWPNLFWYGGHPSCEIYFSHKVFHGLLWFAQIHLHPLVCIYIHQQSSILQSLPPPQALRFAFWSKASAKREWLVTNRSARDHGKEKEAFSFPPSFARREREREKDRERDVWKRDSFNPMHLHSLTYVSIQQDASAFTYTSLYSLTRICIN